MDLIQLLQTLQKLLTLKTMPRGILGSLAVAIILFVAVALVLVGMFHYSQYADNAEPVGWALRKVAMEL